MLNFSVLPFCGAENMEIGNGYGVPGGGAYFNGMRPPMFTIAAAPSMYKPEFGLPSPKSSVERGPIGPFEGPMGPGQGQERFVDPSGAKGMTHRSTDQGVTGRIEYDSRDAKEAEGTLEKGNIPDFLKERLKARGILKDDNSNGSANLVTHLFFL